MSRPLALRLLPHRLRSSLYYRRYHARHSQWRELFATAPLHFAPAVVMHDLVPGDVISGNIAFTGFYELALSREIARLGRRGGLLVDVGANMGYFSLLWAGADPGNEVIAYEPSPRNVRLLEANVHRNDLATRVRVVPKAAGDRKGLIAFDLGPEEQTGWGGIATPARAGALQVPMVRLDDEIAHRSVDVLKVDVEGADLLVLKGCEGLLRARRVGCIFFEQNSERMHELGLSGSDAAAFLEAVGYECRPFSRETSEWVARPRKA